MPTATISPITDAVVETKPSSRRKPAAEAAGVGVWVSIESHACCVPYTASAQTTAMSAIARDGSYGAVIREPYRLGQSRFGKS